MAISSDPRIRSRELSQRLELDFPLLSDPDMEVIQRWGVAQQGRDIALPAVYVVAPSGRILYRQIGEHQADRAAPEAITDAIEAWAAAREDAS